jgi:hypothetical protein
MICNENIDTVAGLLAVGFRKKPSVCAPYVPNPVCIEYPVVEVKNHLSNFD